MNSLYLDTNFFIYISDASSLFYRNCLGLIKYASSNHINLVTSAETIQEIIHVSKRAKRLAKGLKTARIAVQLTNELLPISKEVILNYLKYVSIYKSAPSRDLIHLAVCLENKIDKIVTFDKDFSKFKELKILSPEEINN